MKSPLPSHLSPARLTISAAVIAAYADLTQDHNPIHLDAEFAARTPMGGVIAHGTMSIGLIWQAVQCSGADLDGASLDIRFVKPVRIGETLCAGGTRHPDEPGTYEVWVRDEHDGDARLTGTLRLLTARPD